MTTTQNDITHIYYVATSRMVYTYIICYPTHRDYNNNNYKLLHFLFEIDDAKNEPNPIY